MQHGQIHRSVGTDIRQMDRPWAWAQDLLGQQTLAVSLRMRHRKGSGGYSAAQQSIKKLWMQQPKAWFAQFRLLQSLGRDDPPVQQSSQQCVGQLWRSRHQGLRRVARSCGLLARHGADLGAGPDDRAYRRQRSLRTNQLHVDSERRAKQKSTSVCRVAHTQ